MKSDSRAGTFPVAFSVPSKVANMGVFAAVFGETISSSTFAYLGPPGGPASTVTLSTSTTGSVAPVNGTPVPVQSTAGFPGTGSILLQQPGISVQVAYTGITSNSFTGTSFPAGAPGIGQGATVTSVNILGPTIAVRSTTGFASQGMLMVEAPLGAPARNIVVSYAGTSPTSFTGVSGYGSQQMPGGGTIIQIPVASSATAYVTPPTGQNLPLINLCPNGPYPDTNAPVTVTVSLPDPASQGIKSGVIVMSVGSPIALPVTGPASSPSVGSPTPGTNPNDIFGLFEWGIGSTLDFDVSEVDQVGFPFQVTTTGTAPPPPADPVLGVGMRPNRDALFAGFAKFLNGLRFTNAAPFLAGASTNVLAPFPVDTRITAPQDIIGVLQGDAPIASSALPTGPQTQGMNITAYYAITALSQSGESMASNILTGNTSATYSQLKVDWQPYPYATGYNVYWSQSSNLANAQCVASNVKATTYIDLTPSTHTGSVQIPPSSNYTYDPLNSYLTKTIKTFFDYYRTNVFVLDDQATHTKWTGTTMDVGGYTLLCLEGSAGQWGNKFANAKLNVCQPLFSTNTGDASLPPAPSWLTAVYSGAESPSSMVFGADGVFGAVVAPGSTLSVADSKNVYNDIVSALNRGITPRIAGNQWVVLPPSYWASAPLLNSASAATGGSVMAGRYRYVITALNVNAPVLKGNVAGTTPSNPIVVTTETKHLLQTGDRVTISGVIGNTSANGTFPVMVVSPNSFSIPVRANGDYGGGGTWEQATETTPSNLVEVSVSVPSNAVQLSWAAVNGPGGPVGAGTASGFNIYRSQYSNGSWSPLQKVNTAPIANGPGTPTTTYIDSAGMPVYVSPPFAYYGDETISNFYAAYFSRPEISINGLGYGFPYADKNGQSTNVQLDLPGPTGLVITLLPWST